MVTTIHDIFGYYYKGFRIIDKKQGQCTVVEPKEEVPFIKRCTNKRKRNSRTCGNH